MTKKKPKHRNPHPWATAPSCDTRRAHGNPVSEHANKRFVEAWNTVQAALGEVAEPKPTAAPKAATTGATKVRRIISGGQTGGDFGGLLAAKELGLETGGTAPKGFRTETGNDSTLADYGLTEHTSPNYPPRTMQNVNDADATVAFVWGPSVGTEYTIGYANFRQWVKGKLETSYKGHRPVAVIQTKDVAKAAQQIREFLTKTGAEVINVAGHRESSQPGLAEFVKQALVQALKPEAKSEAPPTPREFRTQPRKQK